MRIASFSSVVIVILLITNALILLIWNSSKDKFDTALRNVEQKLIVEQDKNIVNDSYACIPYLAIDQMVNLEKPVLTIEQSRIDFGEYIESEYTYVLRYFNSSCLSCFESGFKYIRDFFIDHPSLHLVIASDFSQLNLMKNFLSQTHFECDILGIEKLIDIDFEEACIPYMLRIDWSGKVLECFPIRKEKNELINCYLNSIEKRYGL